jgi:putative FmdB family regulatory protein
MWVSPSATQKPEPLLHERRKISFREMRKRPMAATAHLGYSLTQSITIMPAYDYHCESCQNDFTIDLSIHEHEEKDKNHEIHCPKCDSTAVKHVIGSVSVVTSRKS